MRKTGENDYEIDRFGQKLMTFSKSINKIPAYYLNYAENARVYDAGIGPRRGHYVFCNSLNGTNNKGAFVLKNKFYRIADSKIFEIDLDGKETEVAKVGHDHRFNILTYKANDEVEIAILVSKNARTRVFDGKKLIHTSGDIVLEMTFEFAYAESKIRVGTQLWGKDRGGMGYVISYDPTKRLVKVGMTGGDFYDGEDLYTIEKIKRVDKNNIPYEEHINVDIIAKVKVLNISYLFMESIEHALGHNFVFRDNVLLISPQIDPTKITTAYDFVGEKSQRLMFESKILGLKATMSGLYIFTEKMVEFLDKSTIQNISLGEPFYPITLGDGGALLNKNLIATTGDRVFYFTKGLNISTINYMAGTSYPGFGELSSEPIVGIKEFLNEIDLEQPSAFAFHNEREKTVQFHLRTKGSHYNNICLFYDLVNSTWGVDTNKNYNFMLKHNDEIYALSDINSSIYKDDVGTTDNGDGIRFRIRTQHLNFYTEKEKLFQGFFVSGGIGENTKLSFKVYIDGESIFQGIIKGSDFKGNVDDIRNNFGIPIFDNLSIGGSPISTLPQAGILNKLVPMIPFDIKADAGSINLCGKRIMIEIESIGFLSDFLIDTLGIVKRDTGHIEISSKF